VVQHLPSKLKALSSNPSTAKKKKKSLDGLWFLWKTLEGSFGATWQVVSVCGLVSIPSF
jgi:hypothetical protein